MIVHLPSTMVLNFYKAFINSENLEVLGRGTEIFLVNHRDLLNNFVT